MNVYTLQIIISMTLIVVSSHFSFTDHHDTSTAEHSPGPFMQSCMLYEPSQFWSSKQHPPVGAWHTKGGVFPASPRHHPDSMCRYPSSPRQNCTGGAQRENSMAPPPPPLSVPPRPCDHNLVFQLRSPDSNPLDIWESQFIAFSVLRILLTRLVYMVVCWKMDGTVWVTQLFFSFVNCQKK